MAAADVQTARAILQGLGAIEAAKILSNPIDTREFLMSNRLELDDTELRELRAEFRA